MFTSAASLASLQVFVFCCDLCSLLDINTDVIVCSTCAAITGMATFHGLCRDTLRSRFLARGLHGETDRQVTRVSCNFLRSVDSKEVIFSVALCWEIGSEVVAGAGW